MLASVMRDGTALYATILTLAYCPNGPATAMVNALPMVLLITVFAIPATPGRTASRAATVCAAVAVELGHTVALDMPLDLPWNTNADQRADANILSPDKREQPHGAPT